MQGMETLELKNQTVIKEFILLGFRNVPDMKIFLLVFFLVVYLMTMVANILLIVLVLVDGRLHTPMYFFLGNLSCLETLYSSVISPRLLSSLATGDRTISISGCFIQHYFFQTLAGVECYLLFAMSYDRYLAICKPLHYVSLMNSKLCLWMAAGSWIAGFFASTITIILMSRLVFCGPNEINHFFCDTFPIVELSCSNAIVLKTVVILLVSVFTLPPFTLTLMSYVFIIIAILKIPSTTGRKKAFSTCSSHLIVVTIYYGTIVAVYVLPDSTSLKDLNKAFSVFYTILTPLVNPLVYGLRNNDVKESLQRVVSIIFSRTQAKNRKNKTSLCLEKEPKEILEWQKSKSAILNTFTKE